VTGLPSGSRRRSPRPEPEMSSATWSLQQALLLNGIAKLFHWIRPPLEAGRSSRGSVPRSAFNRCQEPVEPASRKPDPIRPPAPAAPGQLRRRGNVRIGVD
jgi:hypothetical protein